MERIMAVLGCEGSYAERLCDFANHRKNVPLKAVAFRDFKQYRCFAKRHRVTLLLAEPELISGEYELMADRVINLCGNPEVSEEDRALVSCDKRIYKYQSGEQILREAMELAGSTGETMHRTEGGRHTRTVVVFSPVGRCYKTSFSLLYAIFHARQERVLFISLETFSTLGSILGETGETGLSDALYHLKQGSLDSVRVASLLHTVHGMDYIPPFRMAQDVTDMEAGDYAALVETLIRESDYDLLVLDAGMFGPQIPELLGLSDLIFMPVPEDAISGRKADAFVEYLQNSGQGASIEKLQRICLPSPGLLRDRNHYIDALILSPLGDFTRGLSV